MSIVVNVSAPGRLERHVSSLPAVSSRFVRLIGPGRLSVDNRRLAFAMENGREIIFGAEGLESLLLFGEVHLSVDAMRLLAETETDVAMLTLDAQQLLGRLEMPKSSRVLTKILQFRVLDDAEGQLRFARTLIQEKIHSQAAASRHYQRQRFRDDRGLRQRLIEFERAAKQAKTLDELRGLEGSASVAWFARLGQLLQPPWRFGERIRRPPKDPVNSLLSLGYTMLLWPLPECLPFECLKVGEE